MGGCWCCPLGAAPAVLSHAVSCRATLCCAVLCRAVPCRAMLCHAVPCFAMLCHALPCCAMLCRAVLCHALPRHPTGTKQGQRVPRAHSRCRSGWRGAARVSPGSAVLPGVFIAWRAREGGGWRLPLTLPCPPSPQNSLCPTSHAPTPSVGVLGGSRHCAQPRCSATVGLRPRITAALWSHSARRDTDAAVPAACSLQPPAAPQAAAVLTLHSNLTLQPSLRCTVTSCCRYPTLRRDLVLQPRWHCMGTLRCSRPCAAP